MLKKLNLKTNILHETKYIMLHKSLQRFRITLVSFANILHDPLSCNRVVDKALPIVSMQL